MGMDKERMAKERMDMNEDDDDIMIMILWYYDIMILWYYDTMIMILILNETSKGVLDKISTI